MAICLRNKPYLNTFPCLKHLHLMITWSNANIFRLTGPLCVEFPGHRWIPRTRTFGVSFDMQPSWLIGWFETPSRSLWRHFNVLYDEWPTYSRSERFYRWFWFVSFWFILHVFDYPTKLFNYIHCDFITGNKYTGQYTRPATYVWNQWLFLH